MSCRRQKRQVVAFAGVFAAFRGNNSCINLFVRRFFSLECCDEQKQLIREVTRRGEAYSCVEDGLGQWRAWSATDPARYKVGECAAK